MNIYFLLDDKTHATFNGGVLFQTVYKLIKRSITNYILVFKKKKNSKNDGKEEVGCGGI